MDVPDLPTYLPKDPSEMAVLSEQPLAQKSRKVVIRQKAQTAMQSAAAKSYPWTISWPTQGACWVGGSDRVGWWWWCVFLLVAVGWVGGVGVALFLSDRRKCSQNYTHTSTTTPHGLQSAGRTL
jgi:hypothetical protein